LNLISDDKIRLAFFRYGSEIERFRVLALNYIQANIIGASSDDLQVIKNGINQLNINELRYLSKSRSETYSFLKNIL
jgi:hypothetical protein